LANKFRMVLWATETSDNSFGDHGTKDSPARCTITYRTDAKDTDMTTLLVIVLIVLLLGGGGYYGRGRWY